MDFVLGILTGVALMLAYGQYVSERAKKHQREQQKQIFDYFFGRPHNLQQELDDAIAREDFTEARQTQGFD